MPTVVTSFDDLERQLQQRTERAMREVLDTSFEDAQNLQSIYFYATSEPKYYHRTGQFGRSARKKDLVVNGNTFEGEIYRDTDYAYPQQFPNPRATGTNRFKGSVPAEEVHKWAENHQEGIVGNPHSWQKTLDKIQQNIDVIFGSYFNK